jgi:hypothetical protein
MTRIALGAASSARLSFDGPKFIPHLSVGDGDSIVSSATTASRYAHFPAAEIHDNCAALFPNNVIQGERMRHN